MAGGATGNLTMSDKPDKKAAEAAPADKKEGGKAAGGGLLAKTPVLMGIIMLVEAVVLFAGLKFLGGGPKSADAAEAADGHGDAHADGHGGDDHGKGGKDGKPKDKKKTVELQVLEARFPNKVSGRTLLFDVNMFVRVRGEQEEQGKKQLADNKALISDRVRTIIAQSDPEKLAGGSEPGLETLRRQVKYQLDEILGDGVIDEVLVPRCIPFRADF